MSVHVASVSGADVLSAAVVWRNIAVADRIKRLDLMIAALDAYHRLHKGARSPRELEAELRERTLDVGLIAVPWRQNPEHVAAYDRGDLVVLKQCAKSTYGIYDEGGPERPLVRDEIAEADLAADYVCISCRPRAQVEAERATFSDTAEQNAARLAEAGDVIMLAEAKAKAEAEEAKAEADEPLSLIHI